jgi:hypothetical protein
VGALRAKAIDVDTGYHTVKKTRRETGTTAAMLRDLKTEDEKSRVDARVRSARG